jgi:head-tail adaptor
LTIFRTKKQPLSAVQAAGTASDPLFIAVVNQWGDAALLRKAKQDAADMTDKTHTILIAGVSDVGADARSSSFYLRTKGRNCVALEAVSSRPEIQCRGEGAPVVIPARFTKDVRADFRAQNRLGEVGWPFRQAGFRLSAD